MKRSVLTLAFLLTAVPAIGHAYTLECIESYLVVVCNDGSRCECYGPNGQMDCVEGPAAVMCCEDAGGIAAIRPGNAEEPLACDYLGALAIPHAESSATLNATCFASWIGTCNDGTTYACDDRMQSCPRATTQVTQACAPRGGARSSQYVVRFTPMPPACESIALDLNRNTTSDCCEQFLSFADYVASLPSACFDRGVADGHATCRDVVASAVRRGDLRAYCDAALAAR
ncbi:hypothetical protein L6R52_16700 [Myxococcota bacterium]|nr:hypothetical protein [Myxococcota bacterium]